MKRTAIVLFSVVALSASVGARAQETLGELLDKGGERLKGHEIEVMLTRIKVIGEARAGKVEGRYLEGGALEFTFGPHQLMGASWRLDEKGRVCVTGWFQKLKMEFKDACKTWFIYEGHIYTTFGDGDSTEDRSQKLIRRQIAPLN